MINKITKNPKAIERIEELLRKSIEKKVFPGGVFGVSNFNKKIRESFYMSFGTIDKLHKSENTYFYDIASLTKPLSTTISILELIKKNRVSFDSKLDYLLEIEIPKDKKDIDLYSLLNHSSGLPAYKEFYKEFIGKTIEENKNSIVEKIIKEPLEYKTSTKQVYSDLGFLLLGKIIEKKANMPLDLFSEKHIYKPLGLDEDIFFNSNNIPKENKVFAPTEACLWRKKTLCGQVHDDNAYALGGVCGHAGLFANIYGVMGMVSTVVDIIKERNDFDALSRDDLIKCVSKQNAKGSWGLGFDTPSDISSSGRYFSKKSFGHLGFTGTSFWVDLERDISIVLLTNRVHPDRNNDKIREFRPLFHDLVMSLLLD